MKTYYKQTIKTIIGILLISMPMWSCKKFVDTTPTDRLVGKFIFDSDASIVAAMGGVYAQFAASPTSLFTNPALYADEATRTSDLVSQNNTYTPDTYLDYFATYYSAIYNANAILDGIDKAGSISPAVAAKVKGEALFIRAFSHFILVNYYGSTPYITTSDANISAKLGNTPIATIYQNIISDLKISAGLLDNTYPDAYRSKANKQAVNALLAKVYLYSKDWVNAEKSATDVITSGLYTINPDLNSVFISTSSEIIYQLYNAFGTSLGSQFVPSNLTTTSGWRYIVRPGLISALIPGDLRKGTWYMAGTGSAATSYYPNKYKLLSTDPSNAEYHVLFRLSEMYLIRAEARAQQNTPASIAAGNVDMQITRSRAGLTMPLVTTTSAQLLTAIANERRIELGFEMGNRWFDLKRTDQAVTVLSALSPNPKPAFDAHLLLLPFYRQYTILNENLKQNPGYPL